MPGRAGLATTAQQQQHHHARHRAVTPLSSHSGKRSRRITATAATATRFTSRAVVAAEPATTTATTTTTGAARAASDARRAAAVVAFGIPVAAALVRLAIGAVVPLVPDESYYWEWSRRLAAGYFDHPPAVAVLVRAGTALLGPTPLGVRLGPQLAGLVGTLCCVWLAVRLAGVRAARRTAVVTALLPLSAFGLVLATPDAPLFAGVALALVALERAVRAAPSSRAATGWWAAAGVCLGLALLAKLTAVLLPVGVLVALATHRGLRRQLARPGPYVAAAVAAVVALPVVLWNARHAWLSVAFQLRHGLDGAGGSPLLRELGFLGALLLLALPLLVAPFAAGVRRALRGDVPAAHLLLAVAVTWTAFFALSALRHTVEANWTAPAFAAAVPLVALGRLTRRRRSWLRAGAASATAVVVLGAACAALPPIAPFGIVPGLPPAARSTSALLRDAARRGVARNFGAWRPLAARAGDARAALARTATVPGRAPWVAADRYQDASELAFLLPDHPTVFSLNLGGRANQYDLWPTFPERAARHDDLLLVLEDRPAASVVGAMLRPHFAHAERWDDGAASNHQLWLLRDWRGDWPVRSRQAAARQERRPRMTAGKNPPVRRR